MEGITLRSPRTPRRGGTIPSSSPVHCSRKRRRTRHGSHEEVRLAEEEDEGAPHRPSSTQGRSSSPHARSGDLERDQGRRDTLPDDASASRRARGGSREVWSRPASGRGEGPSAKAALGVAADKVKQTLEFLGKYEQSVV